MRAQGAGNVHHRYAERQALLLARRVQFPRDVQIRAADVTVDEEREIRRVDSALEVVLVHLDQIVIPLLGPLRGRIVATLKRASRTGRTKSHDAFMRYYCLAR